MILIFCVFESLGVGDGYKICFFFFFQAEDGIRDRSPSRGLGDVYKRQVRNAEKDQGTGTSEPSLTCRERILKKIGCLSYGTKEERTKEIVKAITELRQELNLSLAFILDTINSCLLYTSDAADEEDSVDLGGRRVIKKKKEKDVDRDGTIQQKKKEHT